MTASASASRLLSPPAWVRKRSVSWLSRRLNKMCIRDSYKWDRPMYAFTGLSVILFEAFYPVLTGVRTARWYTTYFNKWFPSWPF